MSRSPSNRHGRESRSSGTECSESGSERGKTSRANGSQTGVGPSIPTPRSHVPEQFEAGSDSELRQSNERTHTDLNLRPQGFMQPPPTELVAAPGSATFGGRPGITVAQRGAILASLAGRAGAQRGCHGGAVAGSRATPGASHG